MPQTILIFDFGANEEAAQQARHKVDAWKQGFRLGNKMMVRFNRPESSEKSQEDISTAGKKPSGRRPAKKEPVAEKGTAAKAGGSAKPDGSVRLLLRLDFSAHEKFSRQRWLDRIPSEEPFKSAKQETYPEGNPAFSQIAELFESLD